MTGWVIESTAGPAGAFHHRDLAAVDRPTVWIHRVERPALVLGSSQRDDLVDIERADELGVEVCSRRSGGGLVLIEPDASCWIDVLIPPSHPRWSDDVNLAFHWVGETWHHTLNNLGVADLRVHTGNIENAEAGRFLCFAGLGPGEVVQERAGLHGGLTSKVVGLSQRRRRTVARFQGLFVNSGNPDLLRRLVLPDAWPVGLSPEDAAMGLTSPLDVGLLPDAFIASLPTAV